MSAGGRAPCRRGAATAAAILLGLACCAGTARAQDQASPPSPESPLRIIERSDYSRYVDGRYVGHAYREARAALAPSGPSPRGYAFSGEAYILEESLHDLRSETRQLDRAVPIELTIGAGGGLRFEADAGVPSLRGLPSIPDATPAPGASWTVEGSRVLDLDGTGATLSLPFLAECRLVGVKDYLGRAALQVSCRFATRYAASPSTASSGARSLAAAAGTHALDIFVDAATRWPLFMRDRFDETLSFRGGGTERRSGFTLVFFEGALPLDRTAAEAAIRRAIASVEAGEANSGAAIASAGAAAGPVTAGAGAAGAVGASGTGAGPVTAGAPSVAGAGAAGAGAAGAPSVAGTANRGSVASSGPARQGAVAGPDSAASEPAGSESSGTPAGAGPGPIISGAGDRGLDEAGVEIAQSQAGIVLRVRDIRFVADSDEVLPSELWRLDAIAAALRAMPGRNFLVEGYSASVGNPAGELALSRRRAKRIADELAARGIAAGRFMYRGLGSSQALAPNDTEAGRAKNRRVEITVLDY